MIKWLCNRWKISSKQLLPILCCFSAAGFLTGFLGEQLMELLFSKIAGWYWLFYLLIMTLLWPFVIIMMSILFGQFSFFKNFVGRLLKKIIGFSFIKKDISKANSQSNF